MQLDTETMNDFFNNASNREYTFLMSEMDKMQDAEDEKNGKHIPIPLTVAILAELIHKAKVQSQKRKSE